MGDGRRLLVVEDDAALRTALVRWAIDGDDFAEVVGVGSLVEAFDALSESFDVLVTDVSLPDGSAVFLVEAAARRRPAPAVVAMSGKANADQGFRLARAGASSYLSKPFTLSELGAAIHGALREPIDLGPGVVTHVGRVPLAVVQQRVRKLMVDQALAMTQANRTRAGRLLGVTRQAVQQMLRSDLTTASEQDEA